MPPELQAALPDSFDWTRLIIEVPLAAGAMWVVRQLSARRWITRETYDEERADDEKRLAYVEARRVEEREGRIKAEERVQALTARWDRALEVLGNIERETIRLAERHFQGGQTAKLRKDADE